MTACSRFKVQVPEAPHSTAIMQPPKVLLALPGDLVSPTETLTHYATKLGGHPVFPGSAAPLEAMQRLTKCGVCSSPLSLVLQARCQCVIVPMAMHPFGVAPVANLSLRESPHEQCSLVHWALPILLAGIRPAIPACCMLSP